uniref:Uncharacterized protein n=2 Tax=Nothobranchius pienaari TaxID=704102 RepID=A0A1A8LGA4_9TELE
MQPEPSDKSQLFNSLKSYLNDKTRRQPYIGLRSIVECVNVGSDNRETLYLCEVCVRRVTKADIRNHIQGSRHIFSYIKTCHPHLAYKWQKDADLSMLARPLIELATVVERKEGTGEVQLFEVPDAVYQKMATESEHYAVALINVLRDRGANQGVVSEMLSLHYPIESQRVVLLTQTQPEDTKPHKASAQNEGLPPPAPHTKNTQTSTKNSRSSVENFSGGTPPIGLSRVVGFKSECGRLQCFLCHCCRIRSSTHDITDHLTSSSHLFNYLMETHPSLLEGMSENSEADFHLLPSLAHKVEQLEGRGQMEIVNVPESFCKQLSGKSYHWCLRMQSSGWVDLNVPVKKEAVKGVAKPAESRINTIAMGRRVKKKKRRRRKGEINTVFNIRMPVHKGAVLVERTSFNQGNLHGLPASSLSHPGPVSRADCETLEISPEEIPSEVDGSPLKQQVDEDYGGYAAEEQIKVTISQDTSENFPPFVEREYDGRGSEERSGCNGSGDWINEGAWSERLLPPEHHGNGWSDSHYRREWGDPGLQSGLKQPRHEAGNGNTHSGSFECYGRQQHQMAWAGCGPRPGSPRRNPDLSGEVESFIETARTNVQTYSGGAPSQSGSISEPSVINWIPLDYSQYQTAPQDYTTPYADQQISQINQVCTFYCNHHQTGYDTTSIHHPACPVSSSGYGEAAGWSSMHPNAFIQPGVYGPGSDVYFKAGIPH